MESSRTSRSPLSSSAIRRVEQDDDHVSRKPVVDGTRGAIRIGMSVASGSSGETVGKTIVPFTWRAPRGSRPVRQARAARERTAVRFNGDTQGHSVCVCGGGSWKPENFRLQATPETEGTGDVTRRKVPVDWQALENGRKSARGLVRASSSGRSRSLNGARSHSTSSMAC